MPQAISIKQRVNVTVAALCILSIAAMGIFSYLSESRQIEHSLRELPRNESQLFQSILTADAEGLARAHSGLTRLELLLRPFAAGSRSELLAAAQPVFNEIRHNNNITHMYFIRNDGTVLLRVHKPEQSDDTVKRVTYLQAAETGKTATGLEMGKNFFSLRSVRPVTAQGRRIGYMEVAEEIDHIFKQMKEINGSDVSLFLSDEFLAARAADIKSEKAGKFSILYPTNKEMTLQLAREVMPAMQDALRAPVMKVVRLGGERYAVGMSPVKDASGATVGVLFSQKNVSSMYASMWRGILTTLVVVVAIVAASIAFLYFSLRRNLKLFEALREHIVKVTTTWNLAGRLEVDSTDEIGGLASDFNLMTEKLAAMVSQLKDSGNELGRVSTDINRVSLKVRGAAEQQAGSVMETSSAITQINASMNELTQGVDSLSLSAAESSSSILQMAASVEEVALNTESVAQSVEEVGSSIQEMTASIKQVGEHAVVLMEAANVTSSSIMEMDHSIKEVEKNALSTVSVSEEVRQDAEMGKQAVDATIAGMNAIRTSSRITSEVIDTLSDRARDIGAILSVIDDVAAQTNLLALNAAIIAAQAGERGRGFGVVAEEIKGLAERTSSSTREIAEVIKGVQDETRRAVEAIGLAEKSIAEGEALSRRSGEALNKIVAITWTPATTAKRSVVITARIAGVAVATQSFDIEVNP